MFLVCVEEVFGGGVEVAAVFYGFEFVGVVFGDYFEGVVVGIFGDDGGGCYCDMGGFVVVDCFEFGVVGL